MNLNRLLLSAIITATCMLEAEAAIPLDYYESLQGLTGAKLKDAVYQLVGQDPDISMLSYGSGENRTWWGFYLTDRLDDNSVVDRYSNDVRYFGTQGTAISGMNIEHSFPKSWWGSSTAINAYKDLHHLMPSEAKINSSKSNYIMDKVLSTSTDNGCTKVGTGSHAKSWEPADKWKGDFSRCYFYMTTAYQDQTWSTAALDFLEQNTYPTLQSWASDLYIEWALADDVTTEEFNRNEVVYSIQKNRNPFIDLPNLMEYIWGDSIGYPLDVNTTRKGGPCAGSVIGDPDDTPVEIYNCSMLADEGDCTTENVVLPSNLSRVWQNTEQYGWKASAAYGSGSNITYYQTEANLVTPELDLSDYHKAYFTFDHACKFASSPAQVLAVLVRTPEGAEHQLAVDKWPAGTNWTFVSTGKVDLTPYCGQKVNILFKYTSTTEEACTWEVKNLVVTASGKNSGILTVPLELQPELENGCPVEYYSLDGRRINPQGYRGIAIRRQGSSVRKVMLR